MSAAATDRIDLAVPDLGVDDLRELMRAVTETTERLQGTHQVLRGEVARLQRELADANRRLRRTQSLAALGEMAAGIAHEIRNPLGSIRLYLQMLSEDLSGHPEQRAVCAKIDRAVTGLDAIVRDVLAFAREMTISPAATTVGQIVDRALADCEALIHAGDVRIVSRLACDLPVEVDAALLTQALGNLLRNAIEAMTESGASPRELRVEATSRAERCPDGPRSERIVISVEDTGPGIPPEVVQRMFNPFFTTRATGTGLGLAIVHRIVDAHGGHVNVRTGRRGGARVELCVPPRTGRQVGASERTAGLVEVSRASSNVAAAKRVAREKQ